MSAPPEARLRRYLEGFSRPDDMQEPPGPDGDPQLAALSQFLQTLTDTLGAEDVILDIGSGRGILAHSLFRSWPTDELRPWYFAVDREAVLATLSLPPAIHNHSQKILFADFLALRLPCELSQVKLVVLRNVLHELDITTTAEVLVAARRIVQSGGQVYLQDIVSLPKGEREKVGWPVDLLAGVLEDIGFNAGSPAHYRSRSGTEWFTLILKQRPGLEGRNASAAARIVAAAREQQRQRRTTRLAEVGRDNVEETLPEFIMLSAEVAALTTQLQQSHYAAAATTGTAARMVAGIPLISLPGSALDYAEELPSSQPSRSGLRAILSSKNLIDLPLLLQRAVSRLWFAGYSERLLFTIPELRASLRGAAQRGVDVRILLVDPNSAAGTARSLSEAYTSPRDLERDVLTTRAAFAEFDEELRRDVVAASPQLFCELRLCDNTLSSSFFFVDDLCVCSLYSSNLTGGTGTAFVFGSSSVQPNGYFQVLLREFQSAWAQGERQVS